jgi:hypothetical protein
MMLPSTEAPGEVEGGRLGDMTTYMFVCIKILNQYDHPPNQAKLNIVSLSNPTKLTFWHSKEYYILIIKYHTREKTIKSMGRKI